MKVILVAIDAKFIHTNLAIRLLKANTTYPIHIKEFTIKDQRQHISEQLQIESPDVIGFSVYIWNRLFVLQLIQEIRSWFPGSIVLGGPEVSYDPLLLDQHPEINYVISGEGEVAFHQLLEAIDGLRKFDSVSSLSYRDELGIQHNPQNELPNLERIKSGYFEEEINPHKIQYIESSRGCPYSCSYCLASLESKVRFFPEEKLYHDLAILLKSGVKVFKFLDRTFNASVSRSKKLFQWLIEHHQSNQVFQFEITGDIFPKELIDYLNQTAPKNLFRFEIGIQSTHEASNLAVDRVQDNNKLFETIRLIQEKQIIDLHLDLIAGLPKETLPLFKNTFNEVFQLGAKELQLGFLKLLKGTKLRRIAKSYGMVYQVQPPYELISSNDLSKKDLEVIHQVESMLEIFWNKQYFERTFQALWPLNDPFQFFLEMYHHYSQHPISGHPDLTHFFHQYLKQLGNITASDLVLFDYLQNHPIKPKIFWIQAASIEEKKGIIREFHQHHPGFALDFLFKRSVLIPTNLGLWIAIYTDDGPVFYPAFE